MTSSAAPLAVGATADILSWKTGFVVKLFHRGMSRGYAEYEAGIARAVYHAAAAAGGFRVPAVGEVVTLEGRHGLVYEQITGPALFLPLLMADEQALMAYARQLADLHLLLHQVPVSSALSAALPLQRDCLQAKIREAGHISPNVKHAAQQALLAMPNDETCLCHGDLHPANILLSDNGGPVVIDWHDASLGCPLADVARTSLLIRCGDAPSVPVPDFESKRQQFHQTYLEHYFTGCAVENAVTRFQFWEGIVAAARLSENCRSSEQRQLAEIVHAHFPDTGDADET